MIHLPMPSTIASGSSRLQPTVSSNQGQGMLDGSVSARPAFDSMPKARLCITHQGRLRECMHALWRQVSIAQSFSTAKDASQSKREVLRIINPRIPCSDSRKGRMGV
jgi:hypothetical protein